MVWLNNFSPICRGLDLTPASSTSSFRRIRDLTSFNPPPASLIHFAPPSTLQVTGAKVRTSSLVRIPLLDVLDVVNAFWWLFRCPCLVLLNASICSRPRIRCWNLFSPEQDPFWVECDRSSVLVPMLSSPTIVAISPSSNASRCSSCDAPGF